MEDDVAEEGKKERKKEREKERENTPLLSAAHREFDQVEEVRTRPAPSEQIAHLIFKGYTESGCLFFRSSLLVGMGGIATVRTVSSLPLAFLGLKNSPNASSEIQIRQVLVISLTSLMPFGGFFRILLHHRREHERKRMHPRAELAAMQKLKSNAS